MPRVLIATVASIVRPRPGSAPAGQGPEYVKAHYTKYEYRIPMRDGVRLFTAVYVAEGHDRRPIRSCMIRTPYSVRPYGADQYPGDLGPSPLFGKAGYIFVYQDVRGRWMSEGTFVNMRPHNPAKKGRRTSTRAPTPTTRSTGWSRTSPNHNGKVGHVGHLVPRLLHGGGDDRRPPGPEGGLAAGADRSTGSSATTGTTTARCSCRTPSTSCRSSASPRPEPIKKPPSAVRLRHARRLRLLPRASGRSPNVDAKLLQGRSRLLERDDAARHLRRVLEGPQPAAAPQEHQAGRDDRRRLVRRREPVRRAGDVPGDRGDQPAATQHPGHGPVDPRRLGRGDGDVARPRHVQLQDRRRSTARQIECPFFEFHLKGKGDVRSCPKAWVFETGTNRWRELRRLAAAEARSRCRSTSTPAAGSPSTPPADGRRGASTSTSATRPSRCRTSTRSRIGMAPEYMVADQRFAARRPDVLVYQTDAAGRGRHARRADRGRAARLDDRDRLGLGRQADRRLPRRLPRSRARTRPACGWAATSSWSAAT